MVSTALRVTGTAVGTGAIRCDEYDVVEEDMQTQGVPKMSNHLLLREPCS